ncbi:MAG: glycosyltransferase [Eubacteriales bacterium]
MIKCINVISDTNIGGAGKILLSFLRNYDRALLDLSVIVPRDSALIPEIEETGVRCIQMDGIADRSYDRADVAKFMEIFQREKPDVVHCHATLSGRIAARRYGCKVVSTRHSVFDQPAWKKIFPFRQMLGWVNNHYSDTIIAVSPAAKENITEIGTDPSKVTVVFNGVDPARVLTNEEKQQVRESYGIGPDEFVCAIIARLEEVKGHSYILQAARLLQDKGEKVRIIIAGVGSVEEALKRQAEALGLRNVIFAGFVTEIYKIENIMDLQLNASYGTEATSLALLEGMSLGVPALVSDFGGNPYVIEEGVNGLIVPKKDAQAICDGILRVMRDQELYESMQRQSPQVFQKRFTSQAMTRGIEQVYRELTGEE